MTLMTDYETIMVFLGILALLVSFGTLLIALLCKALYNNAKKKRRTYLTEYPKYLNKETPMVFRL